MSEKATFIEKIPPVSSDSAAANIDLASLDGGAAGESLQTISSLDHAAFYSFLGNSILLGAIGVFFAVRAFKNTKSVNFKVSAGFGFFALILAAFSFLMKSSYAGYLEGGAAVSFSLRAFAWVLFGPALFLILSLLDTIKVQGKGTLSIPMALAAAIFIFIGLAQSGLGEGLKIAFSAVAIISSALLTIGIFTFLAKLPDDLDDNFIKGFQTVVLVIACGWLFYPMLNMLSHFIDKPALFHTLLNFVDLGTVAAIAYGFLVCMTFKVRHAAVLHGKNLKKPKLVEKAAPEKAPAKPQKPSGPSARSLTD